MRRLSRMAPSSARDFADFLCFSRRGSSEVLLAIAARVRLITEAFTGFFVAREDCNFWNHVLGYLPFRPSTNLTEIARNIS